MGPDALLGLGLARTQPRHDVCGNQTYVFHLAGLPHQNRRNLGAVTPVPPPFLSRSYVDDFRHVLLISDANSVPDSTDNDRDEDHAESYSSRAESHFDRGDGQNDCG